MELEVMKNRIEQRFTQITSNVIVINSKVEGSNLGIEMKKD